MRTCPRRRLLQALGGLTAGSVAGCTGTDGFGPAADGTTTTAESITTDTTSETPTETATEQTTTPEADIATEAWRVDSFDGDVKGLWLPNRPRKPNTTGGPLYVGTTDGTVANLSVASGEERWRTTVLGALTQNGYPKVSEAGPGLVAVSQTWTEDTLRNYAEFLDPETGERQWSFSAREFLTPLGVVDGVLYLAGEYIRAPPMELGPNQDPAGEGHLHALDLATGEELWDTTVESLVSASVARHGIYANVYSDESPNHQLVAFDHDGTERWRKQGGKYQLPEPVPIDDGVIANVYTNSVALLDADGTERWRVSAWYRGPSEIAVTPERIYVGSRPLLALSQSGEQHWRLDDRGGIIKPVRDERREKTLYDGGGTRVGAIDAGTGTARWTFELDDEKYVHEQAIVDAGLLVNTGIGWDHDFILLDEMTGDVLGDFSTSEAYFSATAVASRVFAGMTGEIRAFDVEP
jgi:outer membrane protein assembly factor BamB